MALHYMETKLYHSKSSRNTFIEFLMQVGDGTTSVTLLASEFLRMAKPFVEDGVHPQVIIKSYRKAVNLVSI